MANTEYKSVIKIEVDGVSKFLNTAAQVQKEIAQIENTLKSQGFKGNEKELKATATAYRNAMLKAAKDIEAAEQKRIIALKDGTKSVANIAKGIVFGGGARDLFRGTIQGLTTLIEKNKNSDASIGKLNKTINNVKSSAASLGVGFLKLASSPLSSIVSAFERATTAVTGYNFEQARTLALLNEQNIAFNEEADAIISSTDAMDERSKAILRLNESSGISSQLSLTASIEEIKSFRELTNLQNKFNNATGNRAAIGEQINRKSAEHTALVKRINDDLLAISKKELEIKKELGTINEAESIKLDSILKTEKKISEEIDKQNKLRQAGFDKIKSDASLVSRSSGDVKADITTAISEGRIAEAKELIRTLDILDLAEMKVLESLNQQKETLSEITKQRVLATDAGAKEFKVFKTLKDNFIQAASDLDAITADGFGSVLFSSFTKGLSDEEIAKFRTEFKANIKRLTTGEEIISLFSDAEIKRATDLGEGEAVFKFEDSKVIDKISKSLSVRADEIQRLRDEETKLNAQIQESGISVAENQKKIAKDREDITNQLAAKTLEIETKSATAVVELLRKNADILSQFGQLDIIDAFLAKETEFDAVNKGLLDNINEIVNTLNKVAGQDVLEVVVTNGVAAIKILNEDLANLYDTQTEQATEAAINLKLIVEQQQKELEALGRDFTKQALADFSKRFADEEEILEITLGEKNLAIKKAESELSADRAVFDAKAKMEQRGYNDDEIAAVKNHTENIISLETDRFNIEQRLRVGAFVQELNDIQKRGGDIDVELRKFQLKEAELTYEHWQNMIGIAKNGAIEVNEESLNAFLTADQVIDISIQLTNAFTNLFMAYQAYQDAVSQKAIDSINAQLDHVNSAISETTSNIDGLEADLEGKRSGRREALLRGIEIEKQREESLIQKKIALERELEAEEKVQSDRRKAAAIAQALINGALAITQVWANSTIPYPAQAVFGGVMTGVLAGITALEIATIEQQEFADGGMLVGNSHAQGGIPLTIDNVGGYSAEGGEAIMSKRTVQLFGNELNEMQKATGSKPLFADGGMLPNFSGMSNALSGSQRRQIEALTNQSVVVRVSDISNMQARVARVSEIAEI